MIKLLKVASKVLLIRFLFLFLHPTLAKADSTGHFRVNYYYHGAPQSQWHHNIQVIPTPGQDLLSSLSEATGIISLDPLKDPKITKLNLSSNDKPTADGSKVTDSQTALVKLPVYLDNQGQVIQAGPYIAPVLKINCKGTDRRVYLVKTTLVQYFCKVSKSD